MVVTLLLFIWAGSAVCSDEAAVSRGRSGKALGYFPTGGGGASFLDGPPTVMFDDFADYSDPNIPNSASSLEEEEEDEDNTNQLDGGELAARARPQSSRPPRPDSPVYYIRLPPSPYMLVPGVGYVSRPPTLRPPPVVQPRPPSQFINLPINFVSNGKPTGVYTWKQDSPITHLNKGPYTFNGRPSDMFLLRNTYNSLYDDALQSFYP